MSLASLIGQIDASRDEVGAVIGTTGSAVSHKLSGRRPWKRAEIDAVLALLSARLGRRVTYEEAFGSPAAGTAA